MCNVLEVDLQRKRISLTMNLDEAAAPRRNASDNGPRQGDGRHHPGVRQEPQAAGATAIASAFARLRQ